MTFTSQKPTVPGWYVYRCNEDENAVKIVSANGELWTEIGSVANMPGEWSSRLVPVCEVEKAYDEGYDHAFKADQYEPWEKIRARRDVEGRET